MEPLDIRLQPLFSSHSVGEVLTEAELLLADAEVGVTFWGSKVLRVRECRGSVYLDTVVSKILRYVDVLPEGGDRDRVLAMRTRVQNLYADANRLIQDAHWFTRSLAVYPRAILSVLDTLIN